MSWPPMSQMTSTSLPKKCTADIMCATVSTMFTSARSEFSSTSAAYPVAPKPMTSRVAP